MQCYMDVRSYIYISPGCRDSHNESAKKYLGGVRDKSCRPHFRPHGSLERHGRDKHIDFDSNSPRESLMLFSFAWVDGR